LLLVINRARTWYTTTKFAAMHDPEDAGARSSSNQYARDPYLIIIPELSRACSVGRVYYPTAVVISLICHL